VKTIGIIGGIGPESTIEYYGRIIVAYREKARDGSFPSILINSIDARPLLTFIGARDFDQISRLLLTAIDRLAQGGASFGLIAANTPHVVFDAVDALAPIPLISIVEATADVAAKRSLRNLGLFGTQLTMESSFYREVFARQGLSIIVPNAEERAYIHEKYMGELFHGIVNQETRNKLVSIVATLKERDGIDGVILGGTELSLILTDPSYAGLPVLDTTQIHVDRAVAMALSQ
jgi:aspartate racemase